MVIVITISTICRVTASFPAHPGYVSVRFNEARDDRLAVASAGPYANQMHLAPDR